MASPPLKDARWCASDATFSDLRLSTVVTIVKTALTDCMKTEDGAPRFPDVSAELKFRSRATAWVFAQYLLFVAFSHMSEGEDRVDESTVRNAYEAITSPPPPSKAPYEGRTDQVLVGLIAGSTTMKKTEDGVVVSRGDRSLFVPLHGDLISEIVLKAMAMRAYMDGKDEDETNGAAAGSRKPVPWMSLMADAVREVIPVPDPDSSAAAPIVPAAPSPDAHAIAATVPVAAPVSSAGAARAVEVVTKASNFPGRCTLEADAKALLAKHLSEYDANDVSAASMLTEVAQRFFKREPRTFNPQPRCVCTIIMALSMFSDRFAVELAGHWRQYHTLVHPAASPSSLFVDVGAAAAATARALITAGVRDVQKYRAQVYTTYLTTSLALYFSKRLTSDEFWRQCVTPTLAGLERCIKSSPPDYQDANARADALATFLNVYAPQLRDELSHSRLSHVDVYALGDLLVQTHEKVEAVPDARLAVGAKQLVSAIRALVMPILTRKHQDVGVTPSPSGYETPILHPDQAREWLQNISSKHLGKYTQLPSAQYWNVSSQTTADRDARLPSDIPRAHIRSDLQARHMHITNSIAEFSKGLSVIKTWKGMAPPFPMPPLVSVLPSDDVDLVIVPDGHRQKALDLKTYLTERSNAIARWVTDGLDAIRDNKLNRKMQTDMQTGSDLKREITATVHKWLTSAFMEVREYVAYAGLSKLPPITRSPEPASSVELDDDDVDFESLLLNECDAAHETMSSTLSTLGRDDPTRDALLKKMKTLRDRCEEFENDLDAAVDQAAKHEVIKAAKDELQRILL